MNSKQLTKVTRAWRAPKATDGPIILESFVARLDEGQQIIHYPGFEAALIGEVDRCGMETVLCYSRERIVVILMTRDQMLRKDAEEYIDHNIIGGSMGPLTPVLLS